MFRKVLAMVLALSLIQSHALADKARNIQTTQDSSFHSYHLLQHIGEHDCHVTGNYIKTRSVKNKKTVIGHLEQADTFELLSVEDGLALICVNSSHKTSPDSWDGMTGWVNADYVDCLCDYSRYSSGMFGQTNEWEGYGKVLDYFERAIVEKWSDQKIVDSGFMEPYYFPDSLDDYGFVLRDINSDGLKELIVFHESYLNPEEDTFLTAVYTLINGYPVRVAESWARNRFYLCADGSLYNEGSNGASYSVFYIFELLGTNIDVREGVLSGDYIDKGKTCYGWFHVSDRADFSYSDYPLISEEEAAWRIENYQNRVIHNLDGYFSFRDYHLGK